MEVTSFLGRCTLLHSSGHRGGGGGASGWGCSRRCHHLPEPHRRHHPGAMDARSGHPGVVDARSGHPGPVAITWPRAANPRSGHPMVAGYMRYVPVVLSSMVSEEEGRKGEGMKRRGEWRLNGEDMVVGL
uniref:Uncharacterized protein n=1 Tax=Oryza brachyantha TaxID=4533 RepID=J3LCN1_ORYBR